MYTIYEIVNTFTMAYKKQKQLKGGIYSPNPSSGKNTLLLKSSVRYEMKINLYDIRCVEITEIDE